MTTATQKQIETLMVILDGLMRRYTERVPDVGRVIAGMARDGLIGRSSDIENDHIAFRTMGVPQLGIQSLEKVFLHCGYERRDAYKFEGKNALVTGSSKGIGSGVALELAKGGANVTINCSSSVTQAEEVAEQIRRMGRKAIVVACDVSDQKAVEDMVQKTVDAFGSLDLFVSNAVYSDRQLMVDADMAGFRRTIDRKSVV
jgi:3-oxoacyl-ACP reductase-like protein